jgi:DNA-binding NarL/FixJ family response regulator
MRHRVHVTVVAFDPLLEAGAASALQRCPDISTEDPGDGASVTVVIVDGVDHQALDVIRAVRNAAHRPEVVLVASDLAPVEALNAIAVGARGLLRRREADEGRLVRAVFTVAAGDCAVPPDLLDRLLEHTEGTQTEAGWDGSPDEAGLGLSKRERQVLTLLAEGRETGEIARELSYSARTVTSVIHDIIHRFRLRNRAHAVAYALRAGLL